MVDIHGSPAAGPPLRGYRTGRLFLIELQEIGSTSQLNSLCAVAENGLAEPVVPARNDVPAGDFRNSPKPLAILPDIRHVWT